MTLQASSVLQRISREISFAQASFHTWRQLDLQAERFSETINYKLLYVDFFHAVSAATFEQTFLSLAKIFDRGSPMSLHKALKQAEQNNDVDLTSRIESIFRSQEGTLGKVKRIRDKAVAHNDEMSRSTVFKETNITPNQIEELIETVKDMTNETLKSEQEGGTCYGLIPGAERYKAAVVNILTYLEKGRTSC